MNEQQEQTGNGATIEKRERGTIARNPRVVAISKISAIVDDLGDDDSKAAVLNFVVTEYRQYLDV